MAQASVAAAQAAHNEHVCSFVEVFVVMGLFNNTASLAGVTQSVLTTGVFA